MQQHFGLLLAESGAASHAVAQVGRQQVPGRMRVRVKNQGRLLSKGGLGHVTVVRL